MYKNGSKYKAVFMLKLYSVFSFSFLPLACIYTRKLTGKLNEKKQIFYSDSAN